MTLEAKKTYHYLLPNYFHARFLNANTHNMNYMYMYMICHLTALRCVHLSIWVIGLRDLNGRKQSVEETPY